MTRQSKFLATDEGNFEMNICEWDECRLSEFLIGASQIEREQAIEISRFLRKQIAQMELPTVTLPLIGHILTAKLAEYGLHNLPPLVPDKSIFIHDRLAISENARRVLERRYLKKDENNKLLETPEEMFRRVARHIAGAEDKFSDGSHTKEIEDLFYNMMTEFRFLPNSPTLMNAGQRLGQLAACFVLPIEDSLEDIFNSVKHAALIHKSGGGTGFAFSRLRPKNSRVGATGGVASGPVSFMKIFNTATEQVKQGGTRRGANMAVLRVDHPDVLEFIHCKQNNSELNNFNISVGATDVFMKAAAAGGNYDLIDPRDETVVGQLNAKEVYEAMVKQAWKNGDPGIIFLDKMNKDNPTPSLGEIESTNPCGEQPLLPMEACNLGSINLTRFVVETEEKKPVIDYDGLRETIHNSVRFLDNAIEMSQYPLPEIDAMVKGNRKIGLGIMGFADLLYEMGIPYNSDRALELAEEVMAFVQKESHEASRALAEERGVFKNFDSSIYKDRGCPMRNATTTTIAPTGTLSIIAGCSSGIEPLFALSFVRRVMDNDELLEINPVFEKKAKQRGFYSSQLMADVARQGSIHNMAEIPEDVRKVFVTAHDIDPEWHIRMQAAFQKHTDNAVSKTVNLPKTASVDDVMKIYNMAYELGCKGVTIYRDGSKENQVLSISDRAAADGFMTAVRQRPETLEGFTTKMQTGMGNLYVTVTECEGKPFEVFATIGKSGRSTTAKTEAIGRLVSLALRSEVKVENIVEQLKGIGGEYPIFQKDGLVLSIPDAIGRILEKRYLKSGNGTRKTQTDLKGEACPECGQPIRFEEGCKTCHHCGFSKCS